LLARSRRSAACSLLVACGERRGRSELSLFICAPAPLRLLWVSSGEWEGSGEEERVWSGNRGAERGKKRTVDWSGGDSSRPAQTTAVLNGSDEYQQSTPSVSSSSTSTYGASFFNIVYNIIQYLV
jgi:hypothetical protein